MRVGLIPGGGGEVGIAWEIGVLAALEQDAGFIASTSAVIAGTSAGAIVGAYAAQGRSMSADPFGTVRSRCLQCSPPGRTAVIRTAVTGPGHARREVYRAAFRAFFKDWNVLLAPDRVAQGGKQDGRHRRCTGSV
jgi:hypothetical protein